MSRTPNGRALSAVVSAVVSAVTAATMLATPAHATTPPPHTLTRPHRAVALDDIGPGALVDVVVPLANAAGDGTRVQGIARSRLGLRQRRARLRALAPGTARASVVRQWAQRQGFEVTDSTPWTVGLRGTASALAHAFGTSLRRTRHEGATFVTPRSAPVVPAVLRGVAEPVVGLDTRPLWSTHVAYGGGDAQVLTSTPVRGRDAGAGATVATVNLSGWHPGDLATYRAAAFGSNDAAPAVTDVVLPGGHVEATPREDDEGDSTEVALDAQAIAGVAPAAGQRMYFAANSAAGYLSVLAQMAKDLTDADPGNDFQTVSSSWGACELDLSPETRAKMSSAISTIVAAGATFFAASGDAGSYDCSTTASPAVDFPATAQDAVGVGGTSVGGDAAGYTVSAWAGSGGGCSTTVTVHRAGPCNGRSVPDIASIADPQTGLWVVDHVQGWTPVGGTSLATPVSAAGLATVLAQAHLHGLATPFLDLAYQHPEAFDDVTSGSNGAYSAGPGYDLVTGLGVPHWTTVLGILAGTAAPAPTGTTEPMLVVDPTSTRSSASTVLRVGRGRSESSFVPNGLQVSGWAASGTTPSSCAAAGAAPTSVDLPGTSDGVGQVSVSALTPGGCVTVSRPVLVDSVAPSISVPVATYVGTSRPEYRFTWPAATDVAPSAGIVLYAVWVRDLTTAQPLAAFYTTGLSYPYPTAPPIAVTAGHTYSVEVATADGAFNTASSTTKFIAPYDDTFASTSRHVVHGRVVSDWTRVHASADYLGSHLQANRKGASYALRVTAHTVTVGVLRSRYGGLADVYVDGVRRTRLDLYAPGTAYRQSARLAVFPSYGRHTVQVRVLGAHDRHAVGSWVFLDSVRLT